MSRKKIALAAVGVLVVAGAAAAVSAPGHRDGWRDRAMMGDDIVGGGFGKRGWFHRTVTKDQFDTRTRERFARFDKNGDNVIDPAEMEAVIKDGMNRRFDRHGHSGMKGKRMLRTFDANHDGKVTKDEVGAEFERRFAVADINSDGKIDDADLPPQMRGRNAFSEDAVGMRRGGRHGMMRELGFLRQADTNKDGVVTKEEVAAYADQRFARLDWNKDGTVDQADREALRKETVDYAVKRMAHRMGAGPDGKVTREQFQAKAAERFARLDVDNDGKITRKELPDRGMRGWHHRHGHHGMGNRGDNADGMPGEGGAGAPGESGESPARN
jgi:Ca2+-binding EF-hand superfamily protein